MPLRLACFLSLLGALACATPSPPPPSAPVPQGQPSSERYRCQVRLILPNGLTRALEADLDRTVAAGQLTERAQPRGTAKDPLYPGYTFTARLVADRAQATLLPNDAAQPLRVSGTATGSWTRYSVRSSEGPPVAREARLREGERLEIETTQQRAGETGLTRVVEDCLPERLVPPPFQHP